MPARKPEECDLLLLEALKKGDLDAAIAFYEPNASFVLDSGQVVTGRTAIREALRGYLAVNGTMEVKAVPSGDGNLALLHGKFSGTIPGPDGKPIPFSGSSTEVVRRQPDGTWLFVIDNPHGGD